MKLKRESKRVLRGRAAGIMIEAYDSKLDLVVEKITSLDEKVDGLEKKFTERFDGVDQRLDRIEGRLDRIESEIVGIRVLLGDHDAAIKRQEQEIFLLKQASPH